MRLINGSINIVVVAQIIEEPALITYSRTHPVFLVSVNWVSNWHLLAVDNLRLIKVAFSAVCIVT